MIFLSSSCCLTTPVLTVQSALCLFSNLFGFFCWIPWRKHLLSKCGWKIGEEVRRKHFCLEYGSHSRILHSPVHLHALLTLLFFQVIERKYSEWTPLKPVQKYVVVYKDFLLRCLDCTFVEGSQCKYLKNVDKNWIIWVMESCVVLEGFYMWKVLY